MLARLGRVTADLAHPQEVLDISFGARKRTRGHPEDRDFLGLGGRDHAGHCLASKVRASHHSRADSFLAHFELRLDHQDEVRRGCGHGYQGRQDGGERNERQVSHHEIWQVRQLITRGIEVSNVRALEDRDPIVRSQRPRQLPVPDINGDHVASTPLQENLGEATSRGSGVQRIRISDVETERVQGSDQLVGASGDEV